MENLFSYSEQSAELARRIVELGVREGVHVGTAESCTGGLVAGSITSVPGSSEVLLGGIVSYDPAIKHTLLNVSSELIETQGVVNNACARQMATGAAAVLGADVAVSITGIAGPGGEEPGKPVGTVYFGLSTPLTVRSYRKQFEGDRQQVRSAAVDFALELIYEGIVEVFSGKNGH